MKWSVALHASGDRPMTREEIVELADAVAPAQGVASGIGEMGYGARLIVGADDREEALRRARTIFAAAVERARLPVWPVEEAETISEVDDPDDPDGLS